MTATCYDDFDVSRTNHSDWSVAWGTLSATLISPASEVNVTQNRFFNFTAQVTCSGAFSPISIPCQGCDLNRKSIIRPMGSIAVFIIIIFFWLTL